MRFQIRQSPAFMTFKNTFSVHNENGDLVQGLFTSYDQAKKWLDSYLKRVDKKPEPLMEIDLKEALQ